MEQNQQINEEVVHTKAKCYTGRSRVWFGTVWNEQELEKIKDRPHNFLIISADDHTQDGQLHWHVLLQNKCPVYLKSIRSGTAHWEVPKHIKGALDYITRKGNPKFQEGSLNCNTRDKADFQGFVEECKTASDLELIQGPYAQFYAQYQRFVDKVRYTFRNVDILEGELTNIWCYGYAGTGKTKWVWDNFREKLYVKSLNKWWDGYDGQEVILLDDWDPSHKCLTWHLKMWADRYPFQGEYKGGSRLIRPKMIIITSNYPIEMCFEEPDLSAIKRRFKVHHFIRFGEPAIEEN